MSAATNRHIEDIVKLIATAESLYIERKGIDKIAVNNVVRLLITSEHDPIALTDAGLKRRLEMIRMNDALNNNLAFWRAFSRELNNGGPTCLLGKLLDRQYDKDKLRVARSTEAAQDNARDNLKPLQRWLLETAEQGRVAGVWMGAWVDDTPGLTSVQALHESFVSYWHKGYAHRREDPPSEIALSRMLGELGLKQENRRRLRQGGEMLNTRPWRLPNPPELLERMQAEWKISVLRSAPDRWVGDAGMEHQRLID
jgi:hypothetical protein